MILHKYIAVSLHSKMAFFWADPFRQFFEWNSDTVALEGELLGRVKELVQDPAIAAIGGSSACVDAFFHYLDIFLFKLEPIDCKNLFSGFAFCFQRYDRQCFSSYYVDLKQRIQCTAELLDSMVKALHEKTEVIDRLSQVSDSFLASGQKDSALNDALSSLILVSSKSSERLKGLYTSYGDAYRAVQIQEDSVVDSRALFLDRLKKELTSLMDSKKRPLAVSRGACVSITPVFPGLRPVTYSDYQNSQLWDVGLDSRNFNLANVRPLFFDVLDALPINFSALESHFALPGFNPNSQTDELVRKASSKKGRSFSFSEFEIATVLKRKDTGITALHYLALEQKLLLDHLSAATFILKNGGNPFILDSENRSAFWIAVNNGHLDLVQVFLSDSKEALFLSDLRHLSTQSSSFAFQAMACAPLKVWDFFMCRYAASDDAHRSFFVTLFQQSLYPLFQLDHQKDCKLEKLSLVLHLVDLNYLYQGHKGNTQTLLGVSVQMECTEDSRFLLEKGADMSISDNCGYTVFQRAIQTCSLPVFHCFLEYATLKDFEAIDWPSERDSKRTRSTGELQNSIMRQVFQRIRELKKRPT